MVARAPSPRIALAAGLLAGCLGFMPPETRADPPSSGNGISAWFNHSGGSSGNQTTAAAPAAATPAAANDQPGPMDKLTSGISKMGKSVKNAFTRTNDKSTSVNPRPKTEDDALSLNKPARPGADFYISLAHFQERAGNQAGAIEQYKRALEVEPTSMPAMLALARVYDRQGQLPEAMKYYEQATANHPLEAAVHNDQGLCYARQQKYPESIVCLQKAVKLQPDRALYRNNLATVQVETGQIDQAIETLSAVHGKAVAHYNVGFLLNRRNRSAEALKQFQLAAASDPNFDAARQWVDNLSAKAAAEHPAVPTVKPAVSQPSQSAVATFVSPAAKPADALPSQNAMATFVTPRVKPAAASTSPSAAAVEPAPEKVETSPGNGVAGKAPASDAVAVATQPSPAVTNVSSDQAEALATSAVKPAPAEQPPAPVVEHTAQHGSGFLRSHMNDASADSKPNYREARRTQPPVVVSQRPTRLPPTPDQIDDYSRGTPVIDGSNRIVPLPPVDPEHYAPSRY